MTLTTTGASAAPRDDRTSITRAWGALLDGAFFAILAILACGAVAVAAHASGAMHVVQTAATAPIAIAKAAVAAPESQSYINRTEWTTAGNLVSLRVYPTEAGRRASAGFFDADSAWAQVVANTPEAATHGMREQFICHWRFAEMVQPGKVSWNLEPSRPVVDGAEMIESRCNPGADEEAV